MSKSKRILAVGLVPLLGAVAALGLAASPAGPELTTPATNMTFSTSGKAQAVSGAAARVPWANLRVNSDSTGEAQNEPFVAVNPNNSKHLVVGANSWQVGNGHFEVFAYVSFDGGQSWASSQPYIDRNAGRINAADPTVAFGPDGSVYFAFVALTPADGAVAVSRSVDGGLSWSSQTWASSFTTGADKPAIAVGNGNLYVYYQNSSLHSVVSSNNGASWSSSTRIETGGRNANPVVDSNGNVSVFYNTGNSIKMARPAAKGYSISTVANTVALQPRKAEYRANIYPAAGVDSNGNLYVAWADGRNAGRGNDIMYSRSVNGGQSWSTPVALNTDGTSADQLMPALAVSASGRVTVMWLDNRNDAGNVNYDVYMASSSDGVNFGANQRVSSVSSNPYNDARTQGTMIGDYFALAAGNGVTYGAWTDTRNNNEDIYLAHITSASDN